MTISDLEIEEIERAANTQAELVRIRQLQIVIDKAELAASTRRCSVD